MATQNENPFKKFGKKFKSARGNDLHEMVKKHMKRKKALPSLSTKHSGSFHGKSNALGHGGRAAQLKARGVPGGVIGMMARRAHAAPGQANYHGKKKRKEAAPIKGDMEMALKRKGKGEEMKRKHMKKKGGLKFGSAEWRAKYMGKKKKHMKGGDSEMEFKGKAKKK